jgi:hypothetical protein
MKTPELHPKSAVFIATSIALATLTPRAVSETINLGRERMANSVNYCLHNTNVDACKILISNNVRASLNEVGCTCGSDDIKALTDGVNLACRTKTQPMKIPEFIPQDKCGPIIRIQRINL